jgi:hypothetical protein
MISGRLPVSTVTLPSPVSETPFGNGFCGRELLGGEIRRTIAVEVHEVAGARRLAGGYVRMLGMECFAITKQSPTAASPARQWPRRTPAFFGDVKAAPSTEIVDPIG